MLNYCLCIIMNDTRSAQEWKHQVCSAGGRIPGWFEHRSRGASISFWLRGTEFPSDVLCLAILLIDDHPFKLKVRPILTMNGRDVLSSSETCIDQLFIFHLSNAYQNHKDLEELLSENEWNHAQVSVQARSTSSIPFKLVPRE
ncbi:hypothetical protein PIB30_004289 [Stylosanthes scabra]|uniref:Uncharacterized protein n=1 Tax=Stylosanthes scabra TaxID=79078 RepID=A0ABU6T5H4_9FABA|nr:hypothetical protein [Stylosanthes scabra]